MKNTDTALARAIEQERLALLDQAVRMQAAIDATTATARAANPWLDRAPLPSGKDKPTRTHFINEGAMLLNKALKRGHIGGIRL